MSGCFFLKHGVYIHVWISDLRHAVDTSTNVWYQCLISDTAIRTNEFPICVCLGDADILLFSFNFSVLLIPLSHQIYDRFSSLEMSTIIENLMQCTEGSQFAVD